MLEIRMGLSVIVLAAGNGKRMRSGLPKVMHKLAGMTMLEHVIMAAETLSPDVINVVYGSGGLQVKEPLSHLAVNWIKQEERLGTGHAVMQALPFCHEDDQVLILYGDVPLISSRTLKSLLDQTPIAALGLIIAEKENPLGLGRIIRNELGNIVSIIEEKDANDYEKQIREVNTGIIASSVKQLLQWLPQLKNNNNQQEYYLTDIVSFAVAEGVAVGGVMAHCQEEMQGVNDRWQLANLERHYQSNKAYDLAMQGVKVMDPARLDVRGKVTIGIDTVLDVNVVLEGRVTIGSRCYIGPNVTIKNTCIADDARIEANSVVDGALIHANAVIGPFARVRPGSTIGDAAKVGNFVEIKSTTLGPGSKASHHSYLGDAVIGSSVNIGAGTIVCNYDGANKWPTTIDDNAFIGSNSSLVAPLHIGEGATIGAGSVISKDAAPHKLTLARPKQLNIDGWKRPEKKTPIEAG